MATYRFQDIAINSTAKKKPVEEDKYTYLGLEHLDPDSIYVTRYGSDVAPKGEKLLMKKGDVLFGKRRAYQKKVAIAPFDGIFSAHGMVLRPNEDVIDKDFFPLFIKSDYFLDAAIKISVGSLSPTINWRDLKELKFDLPSLSEQRKLAKVLWSIYETKETYKKMIKSIDELVKSQFIEMFGNYDTIRLDKIAKISAGQSSPKEDEFSEEGTPFIKAGNLEGLKLHQYEEYNCNLVSPEIAGKKKLKIHETGTILVAKSGMSCNSGHVYVLKEEAYVVSHLACIKPNKNVPSNYIKIFFIVTGVQSLIKDAGYPSIQLGQFAEMSVPNAPYELMEEFDVFVRRSDKSKFALQESIKNLDALSKKIIAENLVSEGKE
ncbi:restriction endonuclease subunit S [Peptacetobacter sp. AB845]|uniref:restriction endonuclease subunit S n=1 Tax=Peptacetobacter sp. AB845 TaxID=3388429 RepID=UPI0039C964B3